MRCRLACRLKLMLAWEEAGRRRGSYCVFQSLLNFISSFILKSPLFLENFTLSGYNDRMLTRDNLEELLATALKNGGDFADIFIEETISTAIACEDNKIEKISAGTDAGAGIRVISGTETAYVASSDNSLESLRKAALKISESIAGAKQKYNF